MKPEPQNFIAGNCTISSPPHVPQVRLHLATRQDTLWHQGEEALEALGLTSPYWAFAWAGGQGLARHILDHPGCVAGKSVLDFASGSGLEQFRF